MSIPFKPAHILLPDFTKYSGTPWSCVACDQYTSQPDYWETADRIVADAPSTLRLIIPEVYLAETEARKPLVLSAMEDYVRTVLVEHPDAMILVERTLGSGETRWGLVGMVDLMTYDYRKGADSLIRATEATVAERIPARTTVRREAPIELPHVMMLIDDRAKTVVEPLAAVKDTLPVAYDHDLMQKSGHLKGYFLTPALMAQVESALAALITPEAMAERYGRVGLVPLLFAVGDGNHSLAAAKTCFEEIRAAIGDEAAMTHPARYALCEVVNLYDESLQFEPIYRVVFGIDPDRVLAAFKAYIADLNGEASPQTVEWVSGDRSGTLEIPAPAVALPVGTVQDFLDEYMKTAPDGATIDYIHGEDTAKSLADRPDAIAFLFDGMAKEELFSTVIADGALPRKTFSMGHAEDKRFYTEARRIKSIQKGEISMKQEWFAWLTSHLKALPAEAKALCVNLYEGEEDGEFDAQLVACASYDREDPDWACPGNELYTTGEELFGFTAADWESALDLMLDMMGTAIAEGILPDAIEYAAAGFVDGDLEEVFWRE